MQILRLQILWVAMIMSSTLRGQHPQYKDLIYATVSDRDLLLDLYIPATENPPLIVWIHGGAWHSGSKENPPLRLMEHGYALASIDYRLSVEAPFPAQIQDIKASIRFLRAHAAQYGYRSDLIYIWGSSAGGHLAALAGVTNGVNALEGDLGKHQDQSSNIQGVVNFFGPSNFLTILPQSTPHGLSVRAPALALLLGKPLDQAEDLARLASPVYHVSGGDPPMMIVHGDQDVQVPVNQALELHAAYQKQGLKSELEILPGAGHSSPDYFQAAFIKRVAAFLNEISK